MPGFFADHFRSIEQKFLQTVQQFDELTPEPHLILCQSSIEIKYLKQFVLHHLRHITHAEWLTFDALIAHFKQNINDSQHIITLSELRFLVKNLNLSCHLENLAASLGFFINHDATSDQTTILNEIRRLNWITPKEFLLKHRNNTKKIFHHCLLFGYSSHSTYDNFWLQFLKQICHDICYFSFDYGDSELPIFERLESLFGEGLPCYDGQNHFSQKHFTAVQGDPLHYALSVLSKEKSCAMICFSETDAAIISEKLNQRGIAHHDYFRHLVHSEQTLFFYAWYHWQQDLSIDSFCKFYTLNQKKSTIDIYKLFADVFSKYPTNNFETLIQNIKNQELTSFLNVYPLLPQNGPWSQFINSITHVAPEIFENYRNLFPEDYPVTKPAFLKLIQSIYDYNRQHSNEPFFSPIYIIDPLSASQLHFDIAFIFFNNDTAIDTFTSQFLSNIDSEKCYFLSHLPCATFCKNLNATFNCAQEIIENNPQKFLELQQAQKERADPENLSSEFAYNFNETITLPATAIERAYVNPEEIWYRYVAKASRETLKFEPLKYLGIFTHQYLAWKHSHFPTYDELKNNIAEKFDQNIKNFSSTLPNTLLERSLNTTSALRIARKLCTIENFPYISSEINLNSTVVLSDGSRILCYGRADAILSQLPFRNTFHQNNSENAIVVVDYKTGATAQNDIAAFTKPFQRLPLSLSGIQLILYGLILRSIGYKHIQLLIIDTNPYTSSDSITLDQALSENLPFIERYLKTVILHGQLGYTTINPFSKTSFTRPIAEIPPSNDIILAKKFGLLWK